LINKIFILFFVLLNVLWFSGCTQTSIMPISQKNKTIPITSQAKHKWTMKPYCVLGKNYTPEYIELGDTMNGVASWYGPNFHGKYTSNGEVYDMNDFTAAHKTWPMDTLVKVTNLDNGKTQIVRINDRGPFKDGRIIDCSYAAGKSLGLDITGLAKVKIEAIGFNSKPMKPTNVGDSVYIAQNTTSNIKNATQKILLSNFGIQVGAFKLKDGAEMTKAQYASLDKKYTTEIKKYSMDDGSEIYRVFVKGFSTEEEAKDYMSCYNISQAIIIRD
jgi:rare lipoprotein A